MIKKFIFIYIIILLFLFNKTLLANDKQKIIENINNIKTLKFSFNQISHDKEETGKCFLKRPHFLKCVYEDKKQKQLIVNRNNLIIHHARYNKSYFYPAKMSYFLDILDNKKFEDLILTGSITKKNNYFEIIFLDKNKGEIILFFDINNFNLKGWEIINLTGGKTNFTLYDIFKNPEISKNLFEIPSAS